MLAVASLLIEYNIIITAVESEWYQFIIQIPTGQVKFEQIVKWLKRITLYTKKFKLQPKLF